MPKEEKEFFDPSAIGPKPSSVFSQGAFEQILSVDDESGALTQILTIEPGVENDEVLIHDYWEEVFILEGEAVDKRLNKTFTAGMYACRPPGMKHGPYAYPIGCKMLEFRYYK